MVKCNGFWGLIKLDTFERKAKIIKGIVSSSIRQIVDNENL